MNEEQIIKLAIESSDGLWAIFWYSLITTLPELLFMAALVMAARAWWKMVTKEESK